MPSNCLLLETAIHNQYICNIEHKLTSTYSTTMCWRKACQSQLFILTTRENSFPPSEYLLPHQFLFQSNIFSILPHFTTHFYHKFYHKLLPQTTIIIGESISTTTPIFVPIGNFSILPHILPHMLPQI